MKRKAYFAFGTSPAISHERGRLEPEVEKAFARALVSAAVGRVLRDVEWLFRLAERERAREDARELFCPGTRLHTAFTRMNDNERERVDVLKDTLRRLGFMP